MPTEVLKRLVEKAQSWSNEDQVELADYARIIEARRTGRYILDADEIAAIREGEAQADRGDFVGESELSVADKRRA